MQNHTRKAYHIQRSRGTATTATNDSLFERRTRQNSANSHHFMSEETNSLRINMSDQKPQRGERASSYIRSVKKPKSKCLFDPDSFDLGIKEKVEVPKVNLRLIPRENLGVTIAQLQPDVPETERLRQPKVALTSDEQPIFLSGESFGAKEQQLSLRQRQMTSKEDKENQLEKIATSNSSRSRSPPV